MKPKIVVISALALELDAQKLPPGVALVYSGVGKINATITTMQAVTQYAPDLVINFGTAGGLKPDLHGMLGISRVVQRDILAEPLSPRGRIPFCTRPHEYFSTQGQYSCGTGDSFVTSHDPWLHEQKIDVVDMELFAIAAVAYEHKLPWLAYKYVTDQANDDSGQEWSNKINHGEALFLEKIATLV
jgi:adenosylhomocysteine nucleosidase